MPEKIYPDMTSLFEPKILQRGPWLNGRPLGITVHHTADRDINQVCEYGRHERIGYHLIIDRNGQVTQTAYLDQRIAHAGKALWRGLSPNLSHIAVAVISWGRLKKVGSTFKSWAGQQVPQDNVAIRPGNLDSSDAFWDEATVHQEKTLWSMLEWLCREFTIDPLSICGHDEAALPKGRKDDPGGVLSLSMPEVRTLIRDSVNQKQV